MVVFTNHIMTKEFLKCTKISTNYTKSMSKPKFNHKTQSPKTMATKQARKSLNKILFIAQKDRKMKQKKNIEG